MQREYTNGQPQSSRILVMFQTHNTSINIWTLDIAKTFLAALGSPLSCFQSALDLHGHMEKHSQLLNQ